MRLLAWLIVIPLFAAVIGLECYDCASRRAGDYGGLCEEFDVDNTTNTTECSNDENFCYVTHNFHDGIHYYWSMRGCSADCEDGEEEDGDFVHTTSCCTTDLCNDIAREPDEPEEPEEPGAADRRGSYSVSALTLLGTAVLILSK